MKKTAKTFISKRFISLLLSAMIMFGLFGVLPQVSAVAASAIPGTITTVAGIGTSGYSGNGGLSTLAKLNRPDGVAFDVQGNMYIADTSNCVIRKVDVNTGIITTIAGIGGTASYSGDGGLATNAKLYCPESIAFDDGGNLYFADCGNNRVRKIDMKTGIISTVVGIGISGYSGDGGLAKNAAMNFPFGVVFDTQGNLYISDAGNRCIRKVDVVSGIITTIAGTGVGGFSGDGGLATKAMLFCPESIAFDAHENLYITDYGNHRIRRIDSNTGIISTVAGTGTNGFRGDNGLAVNAYLSGPKGIALDAQGNLYFSDTNNNRIRKIDVKTGIISTVVGNGVRGYSGDNGSAVNAQLFTPIGVTIDSQGNLFIADHTNNRIRSVANINGCIVSFNSNGVNEAISIIANNGTTIKEPTTLTKAGYVLTGWYKDAVLATPWNFDTDVVTSNITLYAAWTPGFMVTLNSKGGSVVPSVSVKTNSAITEPIVATMTGYTLVGWYTSSTSLVKVVFPYTVKNNITLYAKWAINSYTVTFNNDNGNVVAFKTAKYNSAITAPTISAKTGYTFNGWYTEATGGTMITFPHSVTENITLYAQWTKKQCTVTFNNDGNVVSTVTQLYNTAIEAPNAPDKTGYSFSGWYTSLGLKIAFPYVVKGDITLAARWTSNSYTVTFNSNGGTAVAKKAANYNTEITAPTASRKTGYVFSGWYTEATGGTKIDSPYVVTANTTVYAQWTK